MVTFLHCFPPKVAAANLISEAHRLRPRLKHPFHKPFLLHEPRPWPTIKKLGEQAKHLVTPLLYNNTAAKRMNYIYMSHIKFHLEAAEIFVDIMKRTSE